MPSLWMNLDASDEERLFRESIRQFVSDVVNPLEREAKRDYIGVSRKLALEAGKIGILGLSIPKTHGGQGASALMQGIAIEELGRSRVIGFGLPWPLNVSHINFAESCPESLVNKWLPRFLSGTARLGVVTTEPKSGSDVATIATTALRDGNEYILNGDKGPISNIRTSDAWIVMARTGTKESGSRGLTEFFLEADTEGIEKYRFDAMEESADLGGIRLTNVRVPADHIVGQEGAGFRKLMSAFDQERALMSMRYLGAAMDSLEMSIEYAKNRRVWGRPIAAFEGVMFPLVEDWTKVEAARSFCYEVLRTYDRGEKITKHASMIRWYVTRVALEALDTCIQVNGAQGYTADVPHERRYRWVRSGLLGHGTQEIQKLIIGREIMGKEIYNMTLGRS